MPCGNRSYVSKGTFTECPKCGARVTKEKLRRHVTRVHGEGATKKATPRGTNEPTVRFPWKAMAALAVVGVLVFATGYVLLGRGNTDGSGNGNGGAVDTTAIMTTSKGSITIHLDLVNAPRTAGNFINLAEAGRYDNNRFHRVVKDFVIQGGDIGATSNVAWENTGQRNVRYSVAMARSGDGNDAGSKDTATSQFFINLKDNANLDNYAYPYVVFGHVIDGTSVVNAIGNLGLSNEEPSETVTIISVRIVR